MGSLSGQPLDGNWTDLVSDFPSGDDTPGDNLLFGLFAKPGDFNGDHQVNATDIDTLSAEMLFGNGTHLSLDINGDGMVNQVDKDILILNVLHVPYGDANLDGVVDVFDFNLWNQNKSLSGKGWGDGDFTGDGVVDNVDYGIWNATNSHRPPTWSLRWATSMAIFRSMPSTSIY